MKTITSLGIFTTICCAIFLPGCGAGSETTNSYMFTASVLDSCGEGVRDVPVALVDTGHIPGRRPASRPLLDTSDKDGVISILVNDPEKEYNLISTSDLYSKHLLVPGITVKEDTHWGPVYLNRPGTLLVYIDTVAYQEGAVVVLQGSEVSIAVKDTGYMQITVPSGLVTVRSIDSSGNLLAHGPDFDGVEIVEDRTVDKTNRLETLTVPELLPGVRNGLPGVLYPFAMSSSKSNKGVAVKYQFSWGDGTLSSASGDTVASYAWHSAGNYVIKARSLSTLDTNVASEWSQGDTVVIEPPEDVRAPEPVTGPDTGSINEQYVFSTTGTVSSKGLPLNYQFSWGDDTYSGWSRDTVAFHGWMAPGEMRIRVRAESDSGTRSEWSEEFVITIYDHSQDTVSDTLSPPVIISGPETGNRRIIHTFEASESVSQRGSPVEYQFFWGDQTYSPWNSVPVAFHAWQSAGTWLVKARSRSTIDTAAKSPWSPTYPVVIVAETVSPPRMPASAYATVVRKDPLKSDTGAVERLTFATGGSRSSYGEAVEYRFSFGDGTASPWSRDSVQVHCWSDTGVFEVYAQARSGVDTAVWSLISAASTVTVVPMHHVTRPRKPSCQATAFLAGNRYLFSTGKSESTLGDSVEYRISWGLGEGTSSWSTTPRAGHTWKNPGTYTLQARARSTRDPEKRSIASETIQITVK